MSVLFFVRHGQAAFPDRDRDTLTPIGEVQARRLGEHWVSRGVAFDQVYSGPSTRHVETGTIVGTVFHEAGIDWPEMEVMDSLDEYQANLVLKEGVPRLLDRDDHIREVRRAQEASADPAEKSKNFQRLFEIVIREWAQESLQVEGVEPWREFCSRVEGAITRIVAGVGRGRRVVAFTSGGPIAVAARHALGTSTQATLELSWMIRNSSISEFLFSGERFTLSTFNTLSHLEDPSLLTYR